MKKIFIFCFIFLLFNSTSYANESNLKKLNYLNNTNTIKIEKKSLFCIKQTDNSERIKPAIYIKAKK